MEEQEVTDAPKPPLLSAWTEFRPQDASEWPGKRDEIDIESWTDVWASSKNGQVAPLTGWIEPGGETTVRAAP